MDLVDLTDKKVRQLDYRLFFDFMDAPCWIMSKNGMLLDTNGAFQKVTHDFFDGERTFSEVLSETGRKKLQEVFDNLLPLSKKEFISSFQHQPNLKYSFSFYQQEDIIVGCAKEIQQESEQERLKKIIESSGVDLNSSMDQDQLEEIQSLLEEKIDKYKLISENVSDIVCLHEPAEGRYLYLSPAVKTILGYEPGELEGLTPFELFHPMYLPQLEKVKEEIRNGISRPSIIVSKILTKNGDFRWIESYSKPIYSDDGEVILVLSTNRDITEQKEAELEREKLLHELKFQKRALDVAALVSITDLDGNITYCNERFANVTAYPAKEMLGKSHDIMKPDDTPEHEWKLIAKYVRSNKIWNGILKCKNKNGDLFWVDAFIVPFADEENQLYQFVHIWIDITEKKVTEADLKIKNFELDTFVYHVSHDIRAPLASILGLSNLISMDDSTSNIKKYNMQIRNSISKLDKFISTVLDHSRIVNVSTITSKIDLEEEFHIAQEEFSYLPASKKITFNFEQKGDFEFHSDQFKIGVILKNLMGNAIKYHDYSKPFPSVTFRCEIRENEAIMVFEDNGRGIRKEYLQKIFDMFYRADESSNGSGLGLYIVKQTIEKLNGSIDIASKYREGTQVKIIVPNHRS